MNTMITAKKARKLQYKHIRKTTTLQERKLDRIVRNVICPAIKKAAESGQGYVQIGQEKVDLCKFLPVCDRVRNLGFRVNVTATYELYISW